MFSPRRPSRTSSCRYHALSSSQTQAHPRYMHLHGVFHYCSSSASIIRCAYEACVQHTLWPEVQKLYGHGNELVAVCCDRNGALLASSCRGTRPNDCAIRIWVHALLSFTCCSEISPGSCTCTCSCTHICTASMPVPIVCTEPAHHLRTRGPGRRRPA